MLDTFTCLQLFQKATSTGSFLWLKSSISTLQVLVCFLSYMSIKLAVFCLLQKSLLDIYVEEGKLVVILGSDQPTATEVVSVEYCFICLGGCLSWFIR